ncbi:MAG: NifU family protein [Bacteroidota bacterium]
MEKTKKYINVYTEANPNPNSLKFVINYMLTPEGISFDYPTLEAAREVSPLAVALFENFTTVARVFIAANFITVTKRETVEWEEVARPIKLFIQSYLEEDQPVFSQEHIAKHNVIVETDSEVVKQIKGILDEYIRPAVETDGGAISFHSFDENTGKVKVLLQGSCSGCPSSTVTLKAGIENLLKRMVPVVTEVEAENM